MQMRALLTRDWPWALGMAVLVVAAYGPVWHAGFVWDDDAHLTENPCIAGGLGFAGIWTTAAATYYPLVLSTWWLGHALWGMSPLAFHLLNVACHAANAVLLWRVLRRLAVPGAWVGAALWALHPVQVESVAWVTELKNTQSAFFYLLSALAFLRWMENRRGSSYALSLGCALGAVLSKSSTVMLPAALGLCCWWRQGRADWRMIARALWPFVGIAMAVSAWTVWEQKFHSGALGAAWDQTWPQRVIIAGRDVWFYLEKLAWPARLTFIYPRWQVDAAQPREWLPPLAVLAGVALVWWKRETWARPCFFALAYFVTLLFPVLGFFSVYFFLYSFVGDHFAYLAAMSPLALTGAGMMRLPEVFRGARVAICTALLVTLGAMSWTRTQVFASDEALWADTLAKNPACWLGQNNLGFELFKAGEAQAGIAHLQKALELRPDYPDALNNLGLVFYQIGGKDKAVALWKRVIALDGHFAIARNNLALALFEAGRREEAIAEWRKALEIKPDYADARRNLDMVLGHRNISPQ
ncbi:MAG: protein O-mannosyl-transferase [Chthoniobacter sp.]|nr:protein O-mannosyl-transferase [Chthoniobacter sp.]